MLWSNKIQKEKSEFNSKLSVLPSNSSLSLSKKNMGITTYIAICWEDESTPWFHFTPHLLEDWFSCSLNLVQKKSPLLTFTLIAHLILPQRPTHTSHCLWFAHLVSFSHVWSKKRSLKVLNFNCTLQEMALSLNKDSTYIGWQRTRLWS